MANFALNYSFSRNLNIPLDEDAVKATLAEVTDYVATKGKCYAGQLFAVTADTVNNGLYLALSTGADGSIIRFATQDKLDEIVAGAGKIDEIRINGSALTINNKVVDIDLTDYASIIYVNDKVASGITESKNYTDAQIYELGEELNWLPVDGEKHRVRFWRGTRANYELLAKSNALDSWTRYTVIDTINGINRYVEYFGPNQIVEPSGQLLPVKSVIGDIAEIEGAPYDRYLVGADGVGYKVYEYVIDAEDVHKWIIKDFDYQYGVRVIDRGLKNYVYINNALKTYDDVDCGEF